MAREQRGYAGGRGGMKRERMCSVPCHCIGYPEPGREIPLGRQGRVGAEGAREAAAEAYRSASSVQSPQPLPYLL